VKEWVVIHKIKALHDNGQGLSIRAISQALKLSRNTVRKYLRMEEVEISARLEECSRTKLLDRHRGYIGYLLETYPKLSAVKVARKLRQKVGELPVSERSLRRYVRAMTLAPAAAPPAVGTRRSFAVYQNDGSFTRVTAVARLVGRKAALFVDEDAPAGGFSDGDLQALADEFDDAIHPAVTAVFGAESDLDQNERVVILFTPAVNRLTPRGAAGFVAGFFYGIDLLPDRQGSNASEVFYSLVPDPSGAFGDVRSRDAVLSVTPAVLAHEFQHMVHFNQRVLALDADAPEALWLAEAMAQFAEEAVARRYSEAGDDDTANLYREGARIRARRYLIRPDTVSLIISTGKGSLPELGAGYLHLVYLQDQYGDDLLRRLTRTVRVGVSNVEAETGRPWPELTADWWSALYFDGSGPESGPRVYPSVDIRDLVGNPYPLVPVEIGDGDFSLSDSLWSSSAAYSIVNPASGGSATLRVGGENGAPSAQQAGLRMRIVRIS
jgi:hypothetical protein